MPENITMRYAERFYDSQTAEGDAPCSCNSSITASKAASIASLDQSDLSDDAHNFTSRTEVCGNTTSPRLLPASEFSSSKPSSISLRKLRRKRHVDALGRTPGLGAAQNGCSRSWMSSTKPRLLTSASGSSKQQHAPSISSHMENELVGNSDFASDQMSCLNVDLHSDHSVNARRAPKGINLSSTEPVYDTIAVRQGVLSSYLHTHLLTWVAGLIIRALRCQWNFLFHMLLSLMLAWYHSFLFALHPLNYMLRAKAKATDAYKRKKVDSEKLKRKLQKRALVVRPALALGARKLAFGSLTALYTCSLLTCLFVASMVLSFSVMKGFVHEPVQLNEYLFFDYTQQFPTASLEFSKPVVSPHTGSLFRRLSCPTRNFRATVYLTVPESDFNKELGIFQVTAELISATGQVLLSKTQPCMLQFRSTALQHVKAFFMAIPSLAGSYLETQTLAVSLLKWQEQSTFSSAALRVVMAPRAGRHLLTGLPELYEAGVSVESELPLWVRFIGNWRWTLSVWLGLALFIGVVVIILGLFNQFLLPDLGLLFSIVSKGHGERGSLKLTVANHKIGKLNAEAPLNSDNAEFMNDDTT